MNVNGETEDVDVGATTGVESEELALPLDVLSWFNDRQYVNKDDVVNAVSLYHHYIRRSYVVKSNNTTRYAVVCKETACPFKLSFNLQSQYGPPTTSIPHICNPVLSSVCRRISSLNFICWMPEVRALVKSRGRSLMKGDLARLLLQNRITLPKKQMDRCFNELKNWQFGSEAHQYGLLQSYVSGMNAKGHFALVEQNDRDVFHRLVIVYREGIQAFRHYSMRGLQLDGTFLKNSTGGVLLIACFLDATNHIRIVSIAIVSGETEANWRWFIAAIREKLTVNPAFIISDRDKGLLSAVAAEFPGVHHAACFRHVMENFNKKFKNKQLKGYAWSLARADTPADFIRAENLLSSTTGALAWLRKACYEKFTLQRSPVRRYGTLTSNNVESLNARFKSARFLPIVELLLEIEVKVSTDRLESFNMGQDGVLTNFANNMLLSRANACIGYEVIRTTECEFLVRTPLTYQVSIANDGKCSCDVINHMGMPCSHLLSVLNTQKIDSVPYCCHSWHNEVVRVAYKELQPSHPITTFESLTHGTTLPPKLLKKRGRPRKSRVESQPSSVALDAAPRRVYRCTKCKQLGHSRRTCQVIGE
jgi:hypothetical protein